jgi:predicted RNase H-like HicB family nuclease
MDIPVVIHKEDGTVYGVSIPTIPGCHSWGETINEAMKNSREAITSHIETLLELGEEVNFGSFSIEELSKNSDYAGGIWALVDVDLSKADNKPERINVSIPRFLLKKIDSYVEQRHETRSGFLARAALSAIAESNT